MGGILHSEKVQNSSFHFDHGVCDGAISILKWGKILVIVMGLTNASGLCLFIQPTGKEPCDCEGNVVWHDGG